ncbi:MAG: Gfo/Idh/MocA family oxidoreductase [Hahellaceae bacterium]|nr:Gfo/Idh/MocA family oxidoreductase [Hahellaceae bacterium]MCP5211729.1 Gfo/Idh/MocA family oxidoreductase [Hahellaceae bacterium]
MSIALVGYGYWGPNVARNLFNNTRFKVHAICDMKSERIDKAKAIFNDQTQYETNFQKLLDNPDIDAIAIAVETSAHFELGKSALLAGKHIYVEKPFTSSVEEAIELEKLAQRLNLRIHVNHIMIFHPVVQKIRELVNAGEIGDILYIDAMRMNLGQIKKDVSAMWDLAVHDLSIIDFLSNGEMPKVISAVGEKLYNPKESLAFLTLRYPGFIAHIHSNWISPLKERKFIVAGTKKMVVFDDMKVAEKLMIYDKGVNVISGENIEYIDYAVKIREGDLLIPYIPREEPLFKSLDHFAHCIENQCHSITGTNQAIRLLNILNRADQKMNQS